MDPLTIASSFATIVGLLCNYKGEKSSQEDAKLADFLVWLQNSNHEDIVELINGNTKICSGIENVLKKNHNDLTIIMTGIDSALASFASKIDSFGEIALAIKPNAELSDQAVSILKQLVDSGCSGFLEIKLNVGVVLQCLEGGNIDYSEPIFLEDDLCKLHELGLLRLNYNSSGSRVFKVTRNSLSIISSLKAASNN